MVPGVKDALRTLVLKKNVCTYVCICKSSCDGNSSQVSSVNVYLLFKKMFLTTLLSLLIIPRKTIQ